MQPTVRAARPTCVGGRGMRLPPHDAAGDAASVGAARVTTILDVTVHA
jgi:hypothetical protein